MAVPLMVLLLEQQQSLLYEKEVLLRIAQLVMNAMVSRKVSDQTIEQNEGNHF